VAAVPNNDLPGVFSARALCRLLAYGLEPTGPVVVAGEGFWADELEARLGGGMAARIPLAALAEVRGTSRVRGVEFQQEGADRRGVKAVAIGIAAPHAPAFEVAAQAGARVHYVPGLGYAVEVDERGRAGDGIWAAGECTGAPPDVEALLAAGRRVADDVLASLGRG
jgi:sarcosine oxidase subunit alpha